MHKLPARQKFRIHVGKNKTKLGDLLRVVHRGEALADTEIALYYEGHPKPETTRINHRHDRLVILTETGGFAVIPQIRRNFEPNQTYWVETLD